MLEKKNNRIFIIESIKYIDFAYNSGIKIEYFVGYFHLEWYFFTI